MFSERRVQDADGVFNFDPDGCLHTYTYDGSGNLLTDTATDPATQSVYVKTYTYTGANLTSESAWVKQ
jgi:YD repeat-containing protein